MRRGDFADAWAINDAVLAMGGLPDDPRLPYHRRFVWDGRPFDGLHVLVRCYHGLGDTLQFARYIPALRRRVASITLEAQAELLPLLTSLPGVDRLVPFRVAAPVPPSACDLEIMEFAHALRLPPQALQPPYLSVPAHRLACARRRLGEGPRIGLCCQGGGWDSGRSVPQSAVAPAVRHPGLRLIRLQRHFLAGISMGQPGRCSR